MRKPEDIVYIDIKEGRLYIHFLVEGRNTFYMENLEDIITIGRSSGLLSFLTKDSRRNMRVVNIEPSIKYIIDFIINYNINKKDERIFL